MELKKRKLPIYICYILSKAIEDNNVLGLACKADSLFKFKSINIARHVEWMTETAWML